jgi:hypothetical protein
MCSLKLSRQFEKSETATFLLRFLSIFPYLLTGHALMAGIASPDREQAKTSMDRIKKAVAQDNL